MVEIQSLDHDVESMLIQRWVNVAVADGWPTLNHNWVNVLCLMDIVIRENLFLIHNHDTYTHEFPTDSRGELGGTS